MPGQLQQNMGFNAPVSQDMLDRRFILKIMRQQKMLHIRHQFEKTTNINTKYTITLYKEKYR